MERKVSGFRECDKSLKHQSMNWDQFKDPLCYPCLVGYVVISWSLTQEVVGSNNLFHKKFITEFSGTIKRTLRCLVMVTLRLVYISDCCFNCSSSDNPFPIETEIVPARLTI